MTCCLELVAGVPTGPIRVIFRCWKAGKMRRISFMNLSESDLWDAAFYWISFLHLDVSLHPTHRANRPPLRNISFFKQERNDKPLAEENHFNPFPIRRLRRKASACWRRTAAGMKKNEWVNPFSVSEILRVTHGQTRVNLLSFNQFSTWQALLCVSGSFICCRGGRLSGDMRWEGRRERRFSDGTSARTSTL